MATLSDLVSTLSQVTGVSEATVYAYGRFARQGGLIAQNGRGLNAARMGTQDAANLLIALAGTPITLEAAKTIQHYRRLRGRIQFCANGFQHHFHNWLAPIGATEESIKADFGKTVEFLLEEASDFGLASFLQTIPVTHVRLSSSQYDKGNLPAHELSTDVHNELKVLPPLLLVGQEVSLNVQFNRTAQCAKVHVERAWGGTTQELLRIDFSLVNRSNQLSPTSDFEVSCQISDITLRVLARALRDTRIPKELKNRDEIADYLFAAEF